MTQITKTKYYINKKQCDVFTASDSGAHGFYVTIKEVYVVHYEYNYLIPCMYYT